MTATTEAPTIWTAVDDELRLYAGLPGRDLLVTVYPSDTGWRTTLTGARTWLHLANAKDAAAEAASTPAHRRPVAVGIDTEAAR